MLDTTYLPQPAQYESVLAWLIANGMTIEQTHSSRLTIDFAGTIGQISSLFDVHFSSILINGEPYISADSIPSIPAAFAGVVLGINRLQPQIQPHKLIVRRAAVAASASIPEPPFTPSSVNQAYAAKRLSSTGERSTTAVIIDTFPLTSDLTTYWDVTNVPQSLSNISFIQTFFGTMPSPTGEETLDTEVASAFAPAGKVRVYGSTDLNYVDDDFEKLISDMQSGVAITQVSMSFGGCEAEYGRSEIRTEHQYFSAIIAMGASLFAASGDSGIYGCDTGKVQTLYPASDPYVTGVGATSLTFSSPTQISQTGWSCSDTVKTCVDDGSSGGGLSTVFTTPGYQKDIKLATRRAVPDLAILGDPNTGVLIVFRGKEEQDGGTSVGAPLMAAYIGLINDTRLAASKSTLGPLNPRIYKLISTRGFTDITAGENGDMAGSGYDLVTGIGTPLMSFLLPKLAGEP